MIKPKEIKGYLDRFVIAQDIAKKTLAVAVYDHLKRTEINEKGDSNIEKSNVLLIGPTGVGKTYIIKTLAKLLGLPFFIANATSYTESGYVGKDVEDIIKGLYLNADSDKERAEKGIIYIDEIDKIRTEHKTKTTHDLGEGTEKALLKLIEGTDVSVDEEISVDTSGILFILGGAFVGLDSLIKERLKKQIGVNTIGFNTTTLEKNDTELSKDPNDMTYEELMAYVSTEDLIKFGFIPEFIGRIPIKTTLQNLTIDNLIEILTKAENNIITQQKELFYKDQKELIFTDSAVRYIASEGKKKETGARGLREIVENMLMDTKFTMLDREEEKIIVDVVGDKIVIKYE